MSKKTLLLLGGAVLAAVAIVAALFLLRPAATESQPVNPPAELGLDQGNSTADDAVVTPEGDSIILPDNSGYITGPNGETQATTVEMGDVPQQFLDQGARLAEVWVNFDSSKGAEREANLATVIPNAADWASHRPSVHTTSKSSGDPTWKTISVVQSARADAEMSMSIDGQHRVVTEVSFQAKHWSSGITYMGSETTTSVWVFIFDQNGALVDVIEPDIA
ncbi:hypothetical protein [Leucobacter sp. cx-169]|uniref:hypothetical protein n=1 Tax=Leucobacter sp. cx-169 TaxID=2770549 RepID=UPI00165E22EE|nr:hypothetical protein [Leucobacter sp. cx-169]MBC9927277.1 hypothetical protein [Leucobacter sp. cx-169]